MELIHQTTSKPKSHDSCFKKKNAYVSKMFKYRVEKDLQRLRYSLPRSILYLCFGCGFPNCGSRGGATIPSLSALAPHSASCPKI